MKNIKLALLVLLLVGGIVVAPFVTIWSLNTLFSLEIAYTFMTWLAVVWLSSITFGNIVYTLRNKK